MSNCLSKSLILGVILTVPGLVADEARLQSVAEEIQSLKIVASKIQGQKIIVEEVQVPELVVEDSTSSEILTEAVVRGLSAVSCEQFLEVVNCPDEKVRPLLEGVFAQVDKTKLSKFSISASQVKSVMEGLLADYGQKVDIPEKRAELIVAVFHEIFDKK